MPEVRLRLSKELDKKVQFFKVGSNLTSKEEAILRMLEEYRPSIQSPSDIKFSPTQIKTS